MEVEEDLPDAYGGSHGETSQLQGSFTSASGAPGPTPPVQKEGSDLAAAAPTIRTPAGGAKSLVWIVWHDEESVKDSWMTATLPSP